MLEHRALLDTRAREIESLKLLIAKLKRMQLGRSSERLSREIEQLELALDELESEAPVATSVAVSVKTEQSVSRQRALPEHLPRERVVHEPACSCPQCGADMRAIGEDVSEVLDYVPGRFRVIRHVRPKLACVKCDCIAQAPAPSRPIERGLPGAGLLAHVLVSKYTDHLPLYRQSEIYAREGWSSNASPIAAEALERIGKLYEIEADIRGRPPDERKAFRQARAGKVFATRCAASPCCRLRSAPDGRCLPHLNMTAGVCPTERAVRMARNNVSRSHRELREL